MNKQEHFEHLRFKNFPIVSWGLNLVFFCLFNQGSKHLQLLHEWNSQNKNALGSHWASSLAFSPFVKVCFTPKYTLILIGLCISHLVANPMLRLRQLQLIAKAWAWRKNSSYKFSQYLARRHLNWIIISLSPMVPFQRSKTKHHWGNKKNKCQVVTS
jgi:hypothetical protein